MKISIVIPAYNAERYLAETLRSVFDQDHDDLEIIVVNDGSTDNTENIIHQFGDRIQYIYQENSGVSAARNRGMAAATGEYLLFLDADDTLLPGSLSERVALISARPHIGILHSGWKLITHTDEHIDTVRPWTYAPRLDTMTWLLWKPVFPGAMLFRREDLLGAGGFDETLHQAEDVDLILRMSVKRVQAEWYRSVTVNYRQHTENATLNSLAQAEGLMTVLDKFYASEGLSPSLRFSEVRIRRSTLMWIVWQLFITGHQHEILSYLQDSVPYMFYPPDDPYLALDWLNRLSVHAHRRKEAPDHLRALWPVFKQLLSLSSEEWLATEQMLDWWLDVWWQYMVEDYEIAVTRLNDYRDLPLEQILSVSRAVAFTPFPIRWESLDMLWSDLERLNMISSSDRSSSVDLYLKITVASLYRRKWRTTLGALKRAAIRTTTWAALSYWFRAIGSALKYGANLSFRLFGHRRKPFTSKYH